MKESKNSSVKDELVEKSEANSNGVDEMYKFWESSQELPPGLLGDKGGKKWTTLQHNGVLFPPEYQPHGIPILYDGNPLHLNAEEEEVATMFANMRKFEYYTNPVFRKNFFREWSKILNKRPENPVKDLNRCNFDDIYNYFEEKRLERLAKTREEKKAIREKKEQEELPCKYCTWDGRQEMVGNFRVEPPGLFRGRGKHPKMGYLKTRIRPEDVTINCGRDSVFPSPPEGHTWKEIVHNQNVVWLACWKDPISGTMKAVFPSVLSSVRACADQLKYEKARSLYEVITKIRTAYTDDFDSYDTERQQRAVCMYFIDKLALRVGGDKELDAEADTVGCTSLRVEHIKLQEPNTMELDFLGKDSIRYQNTVSVLPKVFDLLAFFIKGKSRESDLFHLINPSKINKYLKSFMDGLTAKVFRTFNASQCLDEEVWEKNVCSADLSVAEKVAYFNEANTKVAVLCNHQRTTVQSNFDNQMASIEDKEQNLVDFLERLEKYQYRLKGLKTDAQKLKMAKEWHAEEHEMQIAWLEKYGEPGEVKQYKKERKDPIVSLKKKAPKSVKKAGHRIKHKRNERSQRSKPISSGIKAQKSNRVAVTSKGPQKIVVKRKSVSNKPSTKGHSEKRTVSSSKTVGIQIKRKKV